MKAPSATRHRISLWYSDIFEYQVPWCPPETFSSRRPPAFCHCRPRSSWRPPGPVHPIGPSLGLRPPFERRRRPRRLEGPKGALPSVPGVLRSPEALLVSGIALVPGALPGHSVPGALLPSVIGALLVSGALQAPCTLSVPDWFIAPSELRRPSGPSRPPGP